MPGPKHLDGVPTSCELLGEIRDVHLHAAGALEVVRAHQGDPHGVSRSQAGWNMCQSVGADEIARSNSSAMRSGEGDDVGAPIAGRLDRRAAAS